MSATLTTSAEADAFMRNYLTRPTDVTARLVFADWLEETCVPHNLAWAHYIRLKADADRCESGSHTRRKLDHQAEQYARRIRANLTIPAELFVGYPRSLLQLLPAPNITVKLANFTVWRAVLELVPESVTRENLVLPLDAQERTLLIAAVKPWGDTAEKLSFILDRDIVMVAAEEADLHRALDREYNQFATEVFASPFTEVDRWALENELLLDADTPIVRFVHLLLTEALQLRADHVLLYPNVNTVGVRYHLDGEWVEREPWPIRILLPVTRRLAMMAFIPVEWASTNPPYSPITGEFPIIDYGLRLHIRVTIQPSPDGPTTQIDIYRERPISF
jgi:uncharacterized protein (TIGR02996 family)